MSVLVHRADVLHLKSIGAQSCINIDMTMVLREEPLQEVRWVGEPRSSFLHMMIVGSLTELNRQTICNYQDPSTVTTLPA